MSEVVKDLSIFIENMIPKWILDEYRPTDPNDPSLEKLLAYFFEFLSYDEYDVGSGDLTRLQPVRIIQNLTAYHDIDSTIVDFLLFIKNKIALGYTYIGEYEDPASISLDIRTLLKNIRDFYISKGTEESIKFFFRSVYGKEADIYYPKEDILRASDGKWFEPYYLGLLNTDDSPLTVAEYNELLGSWAEGQTSNSTGYIDSIPLEAVPNATKTTTAIQWVAVGSRIGQFFEDEEVIFRDLENDEILGTYKTKKIGYDALDSTYPDTPYDYLGAWSANTSYEVGDAIYYGSGSEEGTPPSPLPNDGYYVCISNNTSLDWPTWQNDGTTYYRSSIVTYGGDVYKVYDDNQDRTYKAGALTPDVDTDNWIYVGAETAGSATDIFVASSGDTYTNGDIVKFQTGFAPDVWRQYQLSHTRKLFDGQFTPDVDTGNWEVIVGALDTEEEYQGLAFVLDDPYRSAAQVRDPYNILVIAKGVRVTYTPTSGNPNTAPVGVWEHLTGVQVDDTFQFDDLYDGNEAQTYTDYIPGVALVPWDIRKTKVAGSSPIRYHLWKLRQSTAPSFSNTTRPSANSKLWYVGGSNFNFAYAYDISDDWVILPGTVDLENIGVANVEGRWIGTDGFLSWDKKLQDSYFYQDFSYVISVDLDRGVFGVDFAENAHPSGLLMFNRVESLSENLDLGLNPVLAEDYTFFTIISNDESPEGVWTIIPTIESVWQTFYDGVTFSIFLGTDYSMAQAADNSIFESMIGDMTYEQFDQKLGSANVLVFGPTGLKLQSIPDDDVETIN